MDSALRVVHLLAATVWVGGTVALVFVAVPPVQRLAGRGARAHAARVRRALAADRLVVARRRDRDGRRDRAARARVRLDAARFDWVLAVKGLLVGLLVAGAYLHDFVLGPGLARQIRAGEPQSLRPILTAIGRANLLVTVAIPILGVLLCRVSPRLSRRERVSAVPDDFDLAALIALRRARQRRRRPRRRHAARRLRRRRRRSSSRVLAGAARHRARARLRLLRPELAPPGRARLELVPLRVRRQPARRDPVGDEPPAARAREDVAVAAEGDGRDRGQPLLAARRARLPGNRARALQGRQRGAHRRGRLDDHAAARPQPLHRQAASRRCRAR